MKTFARLGGVLVVAVLTPALAQTDEPAKAQFQVIKLQTLSKTGAQHDWSKPEFTDALMGSEGWEVLLASDAGILLRKTKDGPKWEYKAVKLKNSPFSIVAMKDVDAFTLILDRMATDSYTLCAVNAFGEYTLFKQAKGAKPIKTEHQTLLWHDVLKSQVASERFKDKEFIETLNKQGGEGWEVCVCNFNAVVLQKSAAKWEYKTVKVTKSPLSMNVLGMDKDDEAAAFILILEGLEEKGWRPCSCNSNGQEILLKRELKKEKEKKE
jgi:hypothetical protein